MWYYDCYFHIICLFSFIITHLIIYFVLRIFFMLFCFVFDEMRQRQSRIMTHSKIVSVVWVFAWIIHESTYFSSFFHFFALFFYFFWIIVFITSILSCLRISYQRNMTIPQIAGDFLLKIVQFSPLKLIKLVSNWSWISVLVKRWIQSVHWWLSCTIAMCVFFSSLECIVLDYSRSFIGMHRILSRSRFFVCSQA